MDYYTYILYSEKLCKFYSGHTSNLSKRIEEHNRGKNKYTKNGIPWTLIKFFNADSKREAVRLEERIKKRGLKGF